MDLKSTKVTARPTTEIRFKKWGLVFGTAKPLVASKNLSRTQKYQINQKKGLLAELHVKNYLISRGYECLFHRVKTPIAEIDLVFRKGQKIILIEVKCLDQSWRSFDRISKKQIQKLQNNCLYIQNHVKPLQYEVCSAVAWVVGPKISFVLVC